MPNWKEVLEEIQILHQGGNESAVDIVRNKYLFEVHQQTGRNVIAYYSGWLNGRNMADASINDKDKNALMATIHGMDRTKGLDLILHTPGGDLGATEGIVDYLFAMFGGDIRAIVPQISMSAGTMIALACKSIMMGKQSNLGPIDPQMGGVPCGGVLSEFDQAVKDIQDNPSSAPLWQMIVSKYHPTFLGACKHAIDWSQQLAQTWLLQNMCKDDAPRASRILKSLGDHAINKSHSRHLSIAKCKEIGLTIEDMEAKQEIQDSILTTHHAFMHTLGLYPISKIVENHMGVAYVEADSVPQVQ